MGTTFVRESFPLRGLAGAIISLVAAAGSPASMAEPPAENTEQVKPQVRTFDTEVDAGQQIAAALKRCKRDNTRVLLEWGHNSYPQSVAFRKQLEADSELKKLISYEFEHVLVDYGQPPGKNVPLSKQHQADPHNEGIPYLTVLDSEGRMFANFSVKPFESRTAEGGYSYDLAAVKKFLKANQASPIAAQAALDKAIAAAKRDQKAVLVYFGAPWCAWCHKLDDWLARPAVSGLLVQDLVIVKIDTERQPGGQLLLNRLSEKSSDGLPYSIVLDSAGQPLAKGVTADGKNIGFPVDTAEVGGFAAMLRKAAKNLKPEQVDAIIADLRQAGGSSK